MGHSFTNWTGSGTGSFSGTTNPASITMCGPITENAAFTQNNVQVTVQTNPAGLSFSVDSTPYTTAQTFSWLPRLEPHHFHSFTGERRHRSSLRVE